MSQLASAGSRLAILLFMTALLAGFAILQGEKSPHVQTPAMINLARSGQPSALAIPAVLSDGGLDLRAGPVPVPLELQMPSINIDAAVLGVGITSKNVMDAPEGRINDPVWQEAFWYRGSAIPGALSTAVIAGHIDGPKGISAVFTHLDSLQPGDPIVVHDTRNGLNVRFSVIELKSYSLQEASDPAVLSQIYGTGPVAGTLSDPSTDGISHLTLITCAGSFKNGTHDHRLVVYANRIP